MRGMVVGDDVAHTADAVASTYEVPPARGAEYLLCIQGDRSFPVAIPDSGELVIGRGPEAGLSLEDPLASRAHLQILRVPDGLRLTDLQSRHGTLLNGEPVTEPRLLQSSDVITVGGTLFVVRRPVRASTARAIGEQAGLLRKLGEELSRVAEYERELSLVVLRIADRREYAAAMTTIGDRMRAIDFAAPIGPNYIAVLMPELDAAEAQSTLGDLVQRFATGIAVAPYDGIDPDALVSGARAAALAATVGESRMARDSIDIIEAGPHRIVVADPAVARLYELAGRLARSTIPVLVLGESGVGKELAAAAVHAFSNRASGPFVSVNCAAIPETLAESELFGYAKGAFSGAVGAKPGHIEVASGGTLFLDEIGELSPAIQAKLLRVLESGELMRVGEVAPRKIDLRIVAATNRDLADEVEAGRFRGDLYFRLGSARLSIPPLRDRPRDLATLATRLLREACASLGRSPLELSISAALALFRHDWKGNIRELRHVIDYGAANAPEGSRELESWHLPTPLAGRARRARGSAAPVLSEELREAPVPATATEGSPTDAPVEFRPIADEVRDLERKWMIAALRATGGLQNRAADLIEMALRTFVTKMKRYGITRDDWSK